MSNNLVINWHVTEEGFVYEFILNGESVSVNKLEELRKFCSGQQILAWQILNQLIDEEQVIINTNQIIVPHLVIAGLSEEESSALNLPEPFPFEIEIKASGNLGVQNFKYYYTYLNGKTRPFVNPKRVGAFLEITPEQTYLLAKEQYSLVEAIDLFNKREHSGNAVENIKNNLLHFAKVKGLANQVGAKLDAYLNNEQVVTPSKISVRLKRVSEDIIEVEPCLCEEEIKSDGQKEIKSLLEEEDANKFINIFDRLPRTREVYPIPGGPKVVFDEPKVEVLGQFKKIRRLSGKDKELFLKTPQQFLDPEVVYFDDFGERVVEIGEHRYRVFPFLKPAKEPWLPPEEGIIVDGTMIYVSPGEAKKFKERLEHAVSEGKKEITWQEKQVPANQDVINAVEKLVELCPSEKTTFAQIADKVGKSSTIKNVLIIKDNFEKVEFAPGKQIRPGVLGLPRSLKQGVRLLPHQREGLEWLQSLWIGGARGGLLADDMGLGKTLQALAFLAWVRELMDDKKIDAKPVLIVAPVVLLKNWNEEYRRFLKPIFGSLVELHGSGLKEYKQKQIAEELNIQKEISIRDKSDAEELIRSGQGLLLKYKEIEKMSAVLTTYETLRDYQFSLGLIDWGVIVIDEAQKIKTPSAMITSAIKAMKYDFGIALTGTPVENTWVDLWSIMDFVQPGSLGSLKEFVRNYQNPLKDSNTDVESLGKKLKQQIGSLMKRRMKEEYLEGLPEKKTKPYEVQMPKEQLSIYLDIVKKARESLPDRLAGTRKQHIFNTIAALRDVSLHPYLHTFSEEGLANLSDDEIINNSARLLKTIEILDEIEQVNEKVIIFIISRKMQRVIHRLIINRYGINCLRPVNGEIMGGRRKLLVDNFQQSKGFNVLIMSPEAAGVGLNVTAANHVIHLSRAWNPAKEDQATDRVYRIGQKLPVNIHLPMAVHSMFAQIGGSFDQKLHRLLESKRQLSRSVLLPPVVEESEWQSMGEEIVQASVGEDSEQRVLTINEIDNMSPQIFEKTVAVIYERMGYQVQLTPPTKDFGADVVALSNSKHEQSLLIQCKHTSDPSRSVVQKGIQEIISAAGVYSRDYATNFDKLVVTNAISFTNQAREIAYANGVKLVPRDELIKLLNASKVSISEVFQI